MNRFCHTFCKFTVKKETMTPPRLTTQTQLEGEINGWVQSRWNENCESILIEHRPSSDWYLKYVTETSVKWNLGPVYPPSAPTLIELTLVMLLDNSSLIGEESWNYCLTWKENTNTYIYATPQICMSSLPLWNLRSLGKVIEYVSRLKFLGNLW